MAWRGSTDIKDRIFGAIIYLIPLLFAFRFGIYLIEQFPILSWLALPLIPVAFIYSLLGSWGDLIIFFILFLAVVRNPRVSHFIRFNTMQALLIDILIFLVGLLLGLLERGTDVNFLVETLYNVVFLGALAACLYSIVQSALGRYAEIPSISDAAYTQVRG